MSDAVGIHSPDFVSEVNHVESAFQKGRPQDGVNLQGTANDLSRQIALVHVPALVPQQRFSNRKRAYRIVMMADDSTKRTGGTGGGSEHVAGRLGTIEFSAERDPRRPTIHEGQSARSIRMVPPAKGLLISADRSAPTCLLRCLGSCLL